MSYNFCSIKPKYMSAVYFYIDDEKEIKAGDYVEIPFGENNNLIMGYVEKVQDLDEDDIPFTISRVKRIVRVVSEEEYDREEDNSKEFDWLDDVGVANLYIKNEQYDSLYDWTKEHMDNRSNKVLMKKIVVSLELCVEKGNKSAALDLAHLYYNGEFVDQDYVKAAGLYKIAADAGILKGIRNLGYCFYYGRHQEKDYSKAYEYFSKGALLYNDANCLYKLGDMFLNGYFVEENEIYAYTLFKRAYEAGKDDEDSLYCMADILYRLGKSYIYGIGVEQDYHQGYQYLVDSLKGFYERRKADPFIGDLITGLKKLIRETESHLDSELYDNFGI